MAKTDLSSDSAQIAVERDFGRLEHTTRVDSRREKKVLINALPMLIVGVVGLGAAFYSGLGSRGYTWPMLILLALIAVVGAGLSYAAVTQLRRGPLVLHLFERGFIVERPRGGKVSARLATTTARLYDFDEPGDSTSEPLPHVAVQLCFADGDTMVLEEPHSGSPDALVELAQRCAGHTRERLRYVDVQRLRRDAIHV